MAAANRFPQVESWSVEFTELGKPQPVLPSYKWSSPVENMACSNPACAGGGFAMGPLYAELIASRRTDNGANGESIPCGGSEFAGRKPLGKTCQNRATVKITVTYRPGK